MKSGYLKALEEQKTLEAESRIENLMEFKSVIYTYEEYAKKLNSMQPVYHLTAGLSNNLVIKTVKQCLEENCQVEEIFSEEILDKYELITAKEAYRGIHFPKDFEELKKVKVKLLNTLQEFIGTMEIIMEILPQDEISDANAEVKAREAKEALEERFRLHHL